MWTELAGAFGAGLGTFAAAFGATRKLLGSKKGAPASRGTSELDMRILLERVDRLEDDVRELVRRPPQPSLPDLSELRERIGRIEDDVRENATGTGRRLDEIIGKLGEVRGTLETLTG